MFSTLLLFIAAVVGVVPALLSVGEFSVFMPLVKGAPHPLFNLNQISQQVFELTLIWVVDTFLQFL